MSSLVKLIISLKKKAVTTINSDSLFLFLLKTSYILLFKYLKISIFIKLSPFSFAIQIIYIAIKQYSISFLILII